MDPRPVGPEKDPGSLPHHSVVAAQKSASACYSRSEEFLSRVSCDLTNEALSGARCPPTPMPPKEPQKRDQGTQMSRHVLPVTQTRGTDTRSDKNRTRNKSHLLPPRDMGEDFMNEEGKTLIPRGKDFSQHKQKLLMPCLGGGCATGGDHEGCVLDGPPPSPPPQGPWGPGWPLPTCLQEGAWKH
ncbi:uncharacterized protein LOC114807248 isoform X2 [Ornithorhynchus anatinus]|uniref:uncharacterized protein LOC114807248 isoform X2 n=1 Tax=Ornithorhynchus anatinus TaxID=9258 RepID=UPI0019D4B3AF|nr:uncharacterized protein LOC114807248 isoform X2 [Ornithorhynchus anatinus]